MNAQNIVTRSTTGTPENNHDNADNNTAKTRANQLELLRFIWSEKEKKKDLLGGGVKDK